jgi:hypothetical protein
MKDHRGNYIDKGKRLTRPPELSGNPTSSRLIAMEEELGEGKYEFGLRSIFFILRSDSTFRKI